ncbi:hypothetical protein BXZ70DRAFT_1026385 [Cristinia sonorae]|uniref:Uncharacterized protein n=1 Tax=Cristinia sonorae TaxID=1940300 RepID=A0A8K0UM69_9AGAR|nr:hypothetical protein BXZ70DRAFT_1026385 [Cristinia sonorae]
MPEWTSVEELDRESDIFKKMQHALAGLFLWEFVISLDFEWSFIMRKRRFNYPMLAYFGGRYITLSMFIILLISIDHTGEVNCQALYQCLGIFAQMMIAFSSMNLAIRTVIIWSSKYVAILLFVLSAGHWGVAMSATTVHAQQIPGQGCVAVDTNRVLLMISFIYSLVFDTIIFSLTAWKLSGAKDYRSRLVRMMFNDGLVFFLLVTIMNIPVVIFSSLNLNPIMNIIFNFPAATLSNILACRAVRRVAYFSDAPTIYIVSGPQLSPAVDNDIITNGISFATDRARSTEIHVQMDAFAIGDRPEDDGRPKRKVKPGSLGNPSYPVV